METQYQVLKAGSVWKHKKYGTVYKIEGFTNCHSTKDDYKPTVVYKDLTGKTWSMPYANWHKSFALIKPFDSYETTFLALELDLISADALKQLSNETYQSIQDTVLRAIEVYYNLVKQLHYGLDAYFEDRQGNKFSLNFIGELDRYLLVYLQSILSINDKQTYHSRITNAVILEN